MLKKNRIDIALASIKTVLQDSNTNIHRRKITEDQSVESEKNEEIKKLTSITPKIWFSVEDWGKVTDLLSANQQTWAWNIATGIKSKNQLTYQELSRGIKIMDIVNQNSPEILTGI